MMFTWQIYHICLPVAGGRSPGGRRHTCGRWATPDSLNPEPEILNP